MAYDPNNVFAKILRGEVGCVRVYEDDSSLAFMDVMPQAEGHTLVVSKEPAESILDLSPEALAAMIKTTQKIAKAVKKALEPEGIVITQFNGPAAGQTVFHVHFHVIPRNENIALAPHARRFVDAPYLEPIAAKIRNALS